MKAMEEEDLAQVFGDKNIQSQLIQGFLNARGDDRLWHARLLHSLGVKGFDSHMLSVLKDEDDKTRIGLLPLLSPEAGGEALEIFRKLADPGKPALMKAIAETASRFPSDVSSDFCRELFETSPDPDVKAYAVASL